MTWTTAAGVIEMPDGVQIRGRGLRKPLPPGELPEVGLYLLGHPPPTMDWEVHWLCWPDFRLPRDRDEAATALAMIHSLATRQRVEIACGGGRGRTGTALA